METSPFSTLVTIILEERQTVWIDGIPMVVELVKNRIIKAKTHISRLIWCTNHATTEIQWHTSSFKKILTSSYMVWLISGEFFRHSKAHAGAKYYIRPFGNSKYALLWLKMFYNIHKTRCPHPDGFLLQFPRSVRPFYRTFRTQCGRKPRMAIMFNHCYKKI